MLTTYREMGLMHITGSRDGPPVKVGVAVTDLTTGLYTSNAVMAALLGRAKTGKGQHIDVALSDCQVATLANIASSVLISGKPETGRWGTAHPSIVPYKGFKTSDGDIMLGGGNDRLFGVLCHRLGRPEWITDERFATNPVRVKHREELERLIEEITSSKTTQEWLDVLEGSGMPYAAINDVKKTLEHEHGEYMTLIMSDVLTGGSFGPRYGQGSRSSGVWTRKAGQYPCEILVLEAGYQNAATDIRSTYGRGADDALWLVRLGSRRDAVRRGRCLKGPTFSSKLGADLTLREIRGLGLGHLPCQVAG